MTDAPFREPPPGTRHLNWRFDPNMTDAEFDAWAEHFVDAVLGDVIEENSDNDPVS